MPIWLRNFTFSQIKEHFENLNKQNQPPPAKPDKLFGPDVQPSYSAKASK